MIYSKTVTTPANTLKTALLSTPIKMLRGLIYQFDLYFPPGSSGLCGVSLRESDVQLYPRGREEYFVGDNVVISFPDLHMITVESGILDILTYNLDTAYEHQIQVRIGIVSRVDFQTSFVPAFSFDKLNDTMESVNTTLDAIKEQGVKKGFTLFKGRQT